MHDADGPAEIELKFQVPDAVAPAVERALRTRTAQEVDLRAVYFDTQDRALGRNRLVLRVRREGDRWVQALKGPGDGLMRRLEDEVVLPHAAQAPAPDPNRHDGTAAGRLLHQALAGGGPLEPLHETDIRRLRRVLRVPGARIELALDRGFVRAGGASSPVQELEMELLEGAPEALIQLASRWVDRYGLVLDPATKSERARWLLEGRRVRPLLRSSEPALAPGLPLGPARAAMLASTLAHALANAAAITTGADEPGHLHQLRVALRRLRTVLRALGPADAGRDDALKALFDALGRARDADVVSQTLAAAMTAARAAGLGTPVDESPRAERGAAQVLSAPATTRTWLALLALTLVHDAGTTPWDAVVKARLVRWMRTARRLAAEWPDLDDDGRHALRRRIKRLRYLIEFSRPLLPPRRTARELQRLQAIQEALGRWHDLVVARDALRSRQDPAALFAAGWLAREVTEAEADCRSATAAWRVARGGLRVRHLTA